MSSGYRLAPALAARLLGVVLVLVAVLVLLLTVLTATLRWPPEVLLAAGVAGVAGFLVMAWLLLRRIEVISLDEQGYRVRLVRGAGVTAAGWRDVEDAVTADVGGIACVVLRLKDGRTTSIPVAAVAGARDGFVTDLRDHLQRAEGLRPL